MSALTEKEIVYALKKLGISSSSELEALLIAYREYYTRHCVPSIKP